MDKVFSVTRGLRQYQGNFSKKEKVHFLLDENIKNILREIIEGTQNEDAAANQWVSGHVVSDLFTVFTLPAVCFILVFSLLLLKYIPVPGKTFRNCYPVQNHCSCPDTEHSTFQFWIIWFKMANS